MALWARNHTHLSWGGRWAAAEEEARPQQVSRAVPSSGPARSPDLLCNSLALPSCTEVCVEGLVEWLEPEACHLLGRLQETKD